MTFSKIFEFFFFRRKKFFDFVSSLYCSNISHVQPIQVASYKSSYTARARGKRVPKNPKIKKNHQIVISNFQMGPREQLEIGKESRSGPFGAEIDGFCEASFQYSFSVAIWNFLLGPNVPAS